MSRAAFSSLQHTHTHTFAMNDGDVFRVFGQPGGQVGNKHGNHAQRRRVVVGKGIARDCAIKLVGVVCVGVGCVSFAG